MEQLFQELINFVKTASPAIWEMAHRQLIVQTVVDFLFIIFTGGLFWFILNKKNYVMEKADNNRYWEDEIRTLYWVGVVASAITFAMVTLINLSEIVGRLINPDFYAIKILMDFVK